MTPRARIVAAQVVVVAALCAVVFFTLLRPDDPRVLSGVQNPGPPEADEIAGDGGNREGDDGRRGRDRNGAGGGGATGVPPTAGPPPATAQVAPAATPGYEGTPADEQYASSLALLGAKVD